jgi:hypothetical protein
MANVFVKTLPANYPTFMWDFKEGLKSAGCIHWASGTGSGGTFTTTPGDVNDVLTAGSKFANTGAWWQGRWPDGRQISIQRGSDASTWRVIYSPGLTFSGGSPSATVAPTAADAQYVVGDASNYWYMFSTSGVGTTRLKAMYQDAAPYGFWLLGHPSGGGFGYTELFKDPLAAGSYPPADPEPYVWGTNDITPSAYDQTAYRAASTLSLPVAAGTGGPRGFLGAVWTNIPALYFRDAASMLEPGATNCLPVNPHNSKDDMLPVIYARYAGYLNGQGLKGVSSLFRWTGIKRNVGDTLSKSTSKDRIVLGHVSAEWDGTTPDV